jgi:transcriptional regulator with XRE-family HTH domain
MREVDPEWWRSSVFDNTPMSAILRDRDFARVFGFLRRRGWSIAALAGAAGLTETRIRAVCSGRQRITSYEVMVRVAAGLQIERGLLGLAYHSVNPGTEFQIRGPLPGTDPARQAQENEEVLIVNTADESAQHARRAGQTNIADVQLDRLEAAVDRICVEVLTGALIPLVSELRQIRDEAFTALEGRQYPRQTRRLYATAARTCGLLAGVAADRFARYDAAANHVRTATVAAELAEDAALAAWVAALHSTVAFWQGRYRTAAMIGAQARHHSPAGVETARLASLEARAWARIGDHDAMDDALSAAARAADQDGPSAGPGFIAFPRANQARVTATASLWIGDHERARVGLTEAVRLLAAEYDSPAHLAAARFDLAQACLGGGSLDDAAAALRPILAEEAGYLAGAVRRGSGMLTRLTAPGYAASSAARELVEDIEAFLARQNSNGEADRAGLTSDRQLPR